ncbi:MAG TPA: tyrosine-type recombinase/integrase [archaeon]|nr:tyrosine-type recombinase/integrase [archaeon]
MNRFTVKTRFRPDTGSWTLDYTNPEGRRRQLSGGNDEQQARRLAVRFQDWLLEGKDPETELERSQQAARAKALSLREFFPVFMQRHGDKQSKNTRLIYQQFFSNFCRCPQLVDRGLSEINKNLAAGYAELRMQKDKVKPATVNREVSLLRNILSRAVEWDLLPHNQLANYRMLKESDKREVLISPDQIAELVSCLEPVLTDIVKLAVYTGLRKENILDLQVAQVTFYDLTGGCEVSLIVKGGKKRRKALGKKAAEILKRNIGTRMEGHVFLNPKTGQKYTSIHHTFDRWVKRLGLKVNGTKLRFHDLRHVTASWLNQRGVPLDVLRYVLDHEDRNTTDRYASLDSLSLGKVLDLMPEITKEA